MAEEERANGSTTGSIRDRLSAAGVTLSGLTWFLAMASESELDNLPASALFFPGQSTNQGETTIDLATGRPLYLRQTVPTGKVYCLLAPLKPLMRTEAVRTG